MERASAKEAEQAELEEEVGERAPAGRRSLELGRDDQDSPHDGDQADEQERLDGDLVRPHHETKGVRELGDDQRQQDPVEHRHGDVDGALPGRDPMGELVNRADEHEHCGGSQQQADCRVQQHLEPNQPGEEPAPRPARRLTVRGTLRSRRHGSA